MTLVTGLSFREAFFAGNSVAGRRADQVPVSWVAPQHELISFVVKRLRVPRRSELAGEPRPLIIAIAINYGATRS